MTGSSFVSVILIVSAIFSFGECQVSDPRIVNGFNVTSMNGYKHQVSIRSKSGERKGFGGGHTCGGSLITNRLVLTAAHCVYNEKTKKYYAASLFVIVMGGLDRYTRDNNTLVIDAAKIVGHKKFNYDSFANDIAIIILSQNVSSGHPTAQPISLATSAPVAGTPCEISGWGTLKYQGSQPNRLQAGIVNINSRAECNQPNRHNGIVMTGMFCAGRFTGINLVDSCQGDSGGPLTCNGILVGITSNGVECALQNFPGIYIDVYSYRKWIEANDSSSAVGNLIVILSATLLSLFYGKSF